MTKQPTAQRPFDPRVLAPFEKRMPKSFQAHLDIQGELGRRAIRAHRASGLSAARFVEACIAYAIDNMTENKGA